MALSLGTLVGYLELDDTKFERKADQADRRMQALELHLKALAANNPKIQIEVDTHTARLEELRAELAELKAKSAEGLDVEVRARDMMRVQMQLDATWAKLKAIGAAADEDTAKVSLLGRAIDKWGSLRGPGMLMTAIAALAPMLIPLAGAATLGFGAIAGGALAAVAGIGVLKLALSGLGSSIQAYQAYQDAMATATTPKERKAAQTALDKSAYGQATPQARTFTRFYADTFQPKFNGQTKESAQASMLPGLTAGMKAMLPVAPVLSAAISKIGAALGDLANKAGHALASPFWKQWIAWLGGSSASSLKLMGSAFGNFIEGIARGIQKFSPDAHQFLVWIDHLAQRFNKWTDGAGFTNFLAGIRQDATLVIGALKELGPALGPFLKGLHEAGNSQLSAISALFHVIGSMDPGVLQALGYSLPYIILGLKGFAIAGNIAKGVKDLAIATKLLAAAEWLLTAAQWALNVALDANPIVLIVMAVIALGAALVYAYKHSETFRRIVNGAFTAIGKVASTVFNFVKKHWQLLLLALLPGLGFVILEIIHNWNKIKTVVGAVVNWIKQHWQLLVSILPLGFVFVQIIKHWNAIKSAASAVWSALKSFASWLGSVFTGAWNAVKTAATAVWNAIETPLKKAWDTIKPFANWVKSTLVGAWNAVKSAIDAVINAAKSAASLASKALHMGGGLNPLNWGLFASGTNDAPGGLAIVGEQGPELVNLPKGAQVTNAAKTAAMMRNQGDVQGQNDTMRVHVVNAGEVAGYTGAVTRSEVLSQLAYAGRRG